MKHILAWPYLWLSRQIDTLELPVLKNLIFSLESSDF